MHFGTAPAAAVSPTLLPGARGAEVRTLQDYLRMVGMLKASDVDGIYGPKTTDAVKGIQASYGLPETGTADGDTWVALRQAVANGLPSAPAVTQPSYDPAPYDPGTDVPAITPGGPPVNTVLIIAGIIGAAYLLFTTRNIRD